MVGRKHSPSGDTARTVSQKSIVEVWYNFYVSVKYNRESLYQELGYTHTGSYAYMGTNTEPKTYGFNTFCTVSSKNLVQNFGM